MPQQFENPVNPEVHRRTTALEILESLDGQRLDAFVAGVGAGGTITGVGGVVQDKAPGGQGIAGEAARAPVLSGGRARPPAVPGLGGSLVPGGLNRQVID